MECLKGLVEKEVKLQRRGKRHLKLRLLTEENRTPLVTSHQSSPKNSRPRQVEKSPVSHQSYENGSASQVAPNFGNWHGPSAYSPYQGSSWMWPPPPPWGWSGVPPVSPSPYFPQLSTTSASPLPFYPQSSATPAASATRPYFPQSSESSPDPFKVCVKTGNISICNGCRNNFSKNDVIVIQHPEFRQFNSPRTGLPT